MTPAAYTARSRLIATIRHHGPDDPRVPQLRHALAAARLEEHIQAAIDGSILTVPQRKKLAGLLQAGVRG